MDELFAFGIAVLRDGREGNLNHNPSKAIEALQMVGLEWARLDKAYRATIAANEKSRPKSARAARKDQLADLKTRANAAAAEAYARVMAEGITPELKLV